MTSTVAVQDLKIGMFIRLELGWMSHPFPLSSFRIASTDQIATIRGLGLERVIWLPEKSDVAEDVPAQPAPAPLSAAQAEAERAAADRRALLKVQREAMRRCEAQFDEAAQAMRQVNLLLVPDPKTCLLYTSPSPRDS